MPIQQIVLFDGIERNHLLPLTATRAIADIRVGILTIKEKWEKYFETKVDILTQDYLQPKYQYQQKENSIFINAHVLPTKELANEIKLLNSESVLMMQNKTIAFQTNQEIKSINDFAAIFNQLHFQISTFSNFQIINFPWDIFTLNGQEIRNDIQLLGLEPNPEKLSATNTILGNEIYVEDGVSCECSVLNAKDGH